MPSTTDRDDDNNNNAEERQVDAWNRDVATTGRWGNRDAKEVQAVIGASILVILATLVAGVVLGTHNSNRIIPVEGQELGNQKVVDGKVVSGYEFPETTPPTLFASPQTELDFVLHKLANNTALSKKMDAIGTSAASLDDHHDDATTADPYVRAAAWLVTTDTTNAEETALIRYALAAFYYETKGDGWTHNENWLSPDLSHCEWYGVECCSHAPAETACLTVDDDKIIQLKMTNNNLHGPLPGAALSLLPDVKSLKLNQNALTGTIPTILGVIPKLQRLYLQYNQLTGTIPPATVLGKTSGVIDTLMVHGNLLEGSFTQDWCETITVLAVDCDRVKCVGEVTCCNTLYTCFYDIAVGTNSSDI